MKLTREERILFLRSILAGVAQVRVEGARNMPEKGGALLVCNHTDLSDGVIQLLYTNRPLVFVAKSELFELGGKLNLDQFLSSNDFFSKLPSDVVLDVMNIAGQFLADVDAMPIIRDYRGSTRKESISYYEGLVDKIVDRLKKGAVVAMYPEGRRSKTRELLPFRGLAARLAITARVPIIPSHLTGNTGLGDPMQWALGKIKMKSVIYRFGDAIEPREFPGGSDKKSIKRLTEKIQESVSQLASRNP